MSRIIYRGTYGSNSFFMDNFSSSFCLSFSVIFSSILFLDDSDTAIKLNRFKNCRRVWCRVVWCGCCECVKLSKKMKMKIEVRR